MAKDTVLVLTAPTTVALVPNANTNMHAPVVVPPTITPSHHTEDVFLITTPFHYWAWEELLESAGTLQEFADIPAGIRYGFLIGLEDYYLLETFAPPNHCTTNEHLEFLNEKYNEEMAKKHLSKGYEPEQLYRLIGEHHTKGLIT